MADLAILSRFQGDAHIKVVDVDTEHTFGKLAELCAEHSIGLHVAPQPGRTLRVRRTTDDDDAEPFPRDMKVKDAGIGHLDCLDSYFE